MKRVPTKSNWLYSEAEPASNFLRSAVDANCLGRGPFGGGNLTDLKRYRDGGDCPDQYVGASGYPSSVTEFSHLGEQ
jgi:hypothetical protein